VLNPSGAGAVVNEGTVTRPWPKADLAVVADRTRQLADRPDPPGTGRERPDADLRTCSLAHDPPILGALGVDGG
jgi:hypothetical protein